MVHGRMMSTRVELTDSTFEGMDGGTIGYRVGPPGGWISSSPVAASL